MLPLFISVRFVPFKPCIFYLPPSFMDQLISRIGYPFDIGGFSALVIENAPSRMSKRGNSAFAT